MSLPVHRTLLEGSGNTLLLETFDRMWLARRWSADRTPDRDYLAEHRALEEAALARDADAAAALLTRHLTLTPQGCPPQRQRRRKGDFGALVAPARGLADGGHVCGRDRRGHPAVTGSSPVDNSSL